MKKYRVAVCLSGELRTWEFCKESITKFFEKGIVKDFPLSNTIVPAEIEVDYFTHTWTTDRKYNAGITDVSNVGDKEIADMVAWLKPKKHLSDDKRNRNTLVEIGTYLDLFQSFHASVKLKRDYEIENNFEYDIVIKSRFDLLFSSLCPPYSTMVYPEKIFDNNIYHDSSIWFTSEANRFNIQDVFFYGTSFSMDRMSNIYDWQMSRRLHTPHEFGRSVERNRFSKTSMVRHNVIRGVWIDPGPTTGGPGVTMNDFMHKVFLGSRQSIVPHHHHHDTEGNYVIVRPFTTFLDPTSAKDRQMMNLIGSKIHFSNFTDAKAVIFDLDGVLVSTNYIHRNTLARAIKDITGIEICVDEKSMMSTKQKIMKVIHDNNLDESLCDKILNLKDEYFFDEIQELVVPSNVIDCLEDLKSRNIKLAIASNSRRMNVDYILAVTNLDKYFQATVAGDEVDKPKPMPDMLFAAYKKLGLQGHDCMKTIFVEDTDEGALAGHRSLSSVVRVNSPEDLNIGIFSKWIN